MKKMLLMVVVGCAAPEEQVSEPDAGLDCCSFYPDENAVRKCVLDEIGTPPEPYCGTVVCRPNGDYWRVNFCTPKEGE